VVSFAPPDKRNHGLGTIVAGDSAVLVESTTLGLILGNDKQESLFIKMDIEGGEWLALQSCQAVFREWAAPVALLLETHPGEVARLGGSMDAVQGLLAGAEFEVWALTPEGLSRNRVTEQRHWWCERGGGWSKDAASRGLDWEAIYR
jgi:hypothetical protein